MSLLSFSYPSQLLDRTTAARYGSSLSFRGSIPVFVPIMYNILSRASEKEIVFKQSAHYVDLRRL